MSERSERIVKLSVSEPHGHGERSEAWTVSERSERIIKLSVSEPQGHGERSGVQA